MKMIKPIVNISKVMDAYDGILCGWSGVLYNGVSILPEAWEALVGLRKNGKKIVLLSNTACRVEEIVTQLYRAGFSPRLFEAVVTAGEIVHQLLSVPDGSCRQLGRCYYNLGAADDNGVFAGLDYVEVPDPAQADFLYAGRLETGPGKTTEDYLDVLSHGASLNLPLLCVGNDTSGPFGDEAVLASGALAEQYAVLGGRIFTVGKPDLQVMEYALAALGSVERKRILMIGDSIATDIRGAAAAKLSGCLVSKGVHVSFLGEGYIPDVTKTRELGNMFGACPDYVISRLRR